MSPLSQGDLVEAEWRTSRRSGGNGGSCVEVADNVVGVVGVRDSKDRSGPVLVFQAAEWGAFVAAVKDGRFRR